MIATQNPIEYEGTYPLPEAQLDRFLFKLDVGYPDEEDERRDPRPAAHRGVRAGRRSTTSSRSSSPRELARGADAIVDATGVSDEVADYVVAIVRATRELPSVELGASPRAGSPPARRGEGASRGSTSAAS